MSIPEYSEPKSPSLKIKKYGKLICNLLRNKLGDDKVLEDVLQELFHEYENSIENIDFRLDIERLKNDIQKRIPCL